ncbi:hypothetical protein DCC81_18855 [Chitinophaga parva]|uniref:Outer membrane protein beta-barrel domain-containing protein n=1 Tax=Chitinophaga parva TaxID=2169414 RepID=A0A2T7BJ43_9BACT|nr:hypothetical protein [Chitinophaga parva]PUZ26284.1 hypothetical protein DCC81_18855 [Chitinophaga parva]
MKTYISVLFLMCFSMILRGQAPLNENRVTTTVTDLMPVFSDDTNKLPDQFNPHASAVAPRGQQVAALRNILKNNPGVMLNVVGADVYNKVDTSLDVSRLTTDKAKAFLATNADSVAKYLRAKGITADMITATGSTGFARNDTHFTKKITLGTGTKFRVVYKTSDSYIVKLGNWSDSANNALYNRTSDNQQVYYSIPLDQLDYLSAPLLSTWGVTGGVFAIPFKYRPQDGSFEPSFSVNGGAGVQLNFNHRDVKSLTILGAIGASTVQLSSYNAKLPEGTEKLTTAGFTPSVSFIYQYKKLQVGIPIGLDVIFDNHTYNWSNQAKPWIALSLGIGIFTSSKPAEEVGQNH